MFKSFLISRISKGGETMKTVVLVLAFVFVVSAGCFASVTAEVDLYSTKNMLTLPNVPLNPDPYEVLATSGLEPDSNLTRWNTAVNGYRAYDAGIPELYGGMLLGDGFWLSGTSSDVITYDAVDDGVPDSSNVMTDMWISLPGRGLGTGGKHLVGSGFAHDIPTDSGTGYGDQIRFTDGTQMLNWSDAADAGWVGYAFQYWTGIGYRDLSFDSGEDMIAGRAYWVPTLVDNLAMIVPADPFTP